MLDTISRAEGANYDTLYGGKTFDDYTQYPEGTNAAGRYQIQPTTYADLSDRTGLTDFSPHTQDLMAAELLQEKGAMAPLLAGDFDTAIFHAARAWASLLQGPGLPGYYSGSPFNQPFKSYGFVSGCGTVS